MPEAADVLARVRAEAADQGGRDGVPISVHGGQRGGHVGNVGEHDSVGDEARVFELFLLFDWIAALDDRSAKGDPVEEVVEGLDFGGLGTDCPAGLGIGDEPQQEQRALDATDFSKSTVEQAAAVVGAELTQEYRWG